MKGADKLAALPEQQKPESPEAPSAARQAGNALLVRCSENSTARIIDQTENYL
jgi:hypothetical protein